MKSFVKQENLASTLNVYKFNHYNNDISLNDSPTCESCPLINPNLKTISSDYHISKDAQLWKWHSQQLPKKVHYTRIVAGVPKSNSN